MIGSIADLVGRGQKLALTARSIALGGATLSGALLVIDLGRPERFLNMLRVFKPQSTMSMGPWVLSGFSVSAGLSSFGDFLHWTGNPGFLANLVGFLGRSGSVLFGMPESCDDCS